MCQVFDPSRVIIEGADDRNATVGEAVQFQLDRKHAGFAELNVVAVSPLGQDLPIEVKGLPGGAGDLIEFTPGVVGRYKLELTYGGENIPGSPLIYIVQEDRSPTVFGKGLTLGQVRDVCLFKIDGRGMTGEPRVEISGRCRTVLQEDKDEAGLYIVKYIPEEVGYTAISIFWNEVEIPGSPFQARICDAATVLPVSGWDRLLDRDGKIDMTIGEEKVITWDVSKAGPGSMDIEIQGPKYDHRLDNAGPGRIKFVFIPKKEGTFTLNTKWNGVPVRTIQVLVQLGVDDLRAVRTVFYHASYVICSEVLNDVKRKGFLAVSALFGLFVCLRIYLYLFFPEHLILQKYLSAQYFIVNKNSLNFEDTAGNVKSPVKALI
jgi:filamin